MPLLERRKLVKASSWTGGFGSGSGSASGGEVETVFVQVGREDAHSSAPAPVSSGAGSGSGSSAAPVIDYARLGRWPRNEGEVQVYESWLVLQARLKGLK